jgi:hypothetical protein
MSSMATSSTELMLLKVMAMSSPSTRLLHLQNQHPEQSKRRDDRTARTVCNPLEPHLSDRMARLDSLYRGCRVRMESMDRVEQLPSAQTKYQDQDQDDQLPPLLCIDNHRPQSSSRISLAQNRTEDVCHHPPPKPIKVPGHLFNSIKQLPRISLCVQHHQTHNKRLFSLVPCPKYKPRQPLQQTYHLQMVDRL